MSENNDKPEMLAFPEDGFIALRLPKPMLQHVIDTPEADGAFIRFKSSEGFRNFLVHAMEVAALVWPDIAHEWRDGDENDA